MTIPIEKWKNLHKNATPISDDDRELLDAAKEHLPSLIFAYENEREKVGDLLRRVEDLNKDLEEIPSLKARLDSANVKIAELEQALKDAERRENASTRQFRDLAAKLHEELDQQRTRAEAAEAEERELEQRNEWMLTRIQELKAEVDFQRTRAEAAESDMVDGDGA